MKWVWPNSVSCQNQGLTNCPMQIDDLEPPYTRYCDGYATAFDTWAPVQSNPNLGPILSELSNSIPPSQYAASLDPVWTLDNLFLMPATRLKYYKKLYTRLLKSTQAGRSDHKLLMGANERLSKLLETVELRSSIHVGDGDLPPPPPPRTSSAAASPQPPSERSNSSLPLVSSISPPPRKSSAAPGALPIPKPGQSVPSPLPSARLPSEGSGFPSGPSSGGPSPSSQPPTLPTQGSNRGSGGSGPKDTRASSGSSGAASSDANRDSSRNSAPTSNTSVSAAGSAGGAAGRASTSTMNAPITELERRLNTERVLDIFTMTPRVSLSFSTSPMRRSCL